MQRLFLRKTDPKKLEANPKLPYFTLVLPPEEGAEEGAEWAVVGALWKAKTGNGYSGKCDENVQIIVGEKKKVEKKPAPEKEERPDEETSSD